MAESRLVSLPTALCCSSFLAGMAHASLPQSFDVQGRVYCDTCRAGFETNATEYIQRAKVRMECRHVENDEVHHKAEGLTDKTGTYNLHIENDHQEEMCEVVLVESPRSDCNEMNNGRNRAGVLLTQQSGMVQAVRYANPLGFLKDDPLPECGKLLQFYNMQDED